MLANEIFRHLLDFIDGVQEPSAADEVSYSNEPNTTVVSTSAVIAGGTDLNAPKNPADIRADSVSMYPTHQHKASE